MFVSGALLCGWLVAFFDGAAGLPEPARMGARMLFLKPGMNRREVESVLDLGGRFATGAWSTGFSSWDYSIGPDCRLSLVYSHSFRREQGSLWEARLTRGQKTLGRVFDPKVLERSDVKRIDIDPKLVEEAIRALQNQKGPNPK